MKPTWYDKLPWERIHKVAGAAGLDPHLVGAFVMTESGGNTWAVRYESAYKYITTPDIFSKLVNTSLATETMFQATSFGLMQIMGGTARSNGYRDPLPKLCDPDVGLLWGCLYLNKLLKKYPLVTDAIAAYNAGSPRKDAQGNYTNAVYVAKVLGYYEELK